MCDIQGELCYVNKQPRDCSAVFYSIQAAFSINSSPTISFTWSEQGKKGPESKNLVVTPTDVYLSFSEQKRVISTGIHFNSKGRVWSQSPCKFLQANAAIDDMRLIVKVERSIKSFFNQKYPTISAVIVTLKPLITSFYSAGRQVPIIPDFQVGWTYNPVDQTIFKDIPVRFTGVPRKAGGGGKKKKKSPRRKLSPRRSPKKEEGEITCDSRLVDIRASNVFRELQLKGKWKLNKAEVCEALGL